MTWFKIDDKWVDHPKTRRAGRDGRSLWVASGVKCGQSNTDGVVFADLLGDYAHLADVPKAKLVPTVERLVAVGLWHDLDALTGCRGCIDKEVPLIAGGDFYYHDWTDYQPTKEELDDPLKKIRERRHKQLIRDAVLVAQIHDRDGSMCRYCGVRVNFRARRGATSGTYDHLDPDGENTLENVVIACRRCNGLKKNRTPEEWVAAGGRPLMDPPRSLGGGS